MTDESVNTRYKDSKPVEIKVVGVSMVFYLVYHSFITERLDNNGIKWLIDGRQEENYRSSADPCTLPK